MLVAYCVDYVIDCQQISSGYSPPDRPTNMFGYLTGHAGVKAVSSWMTCCSKLAHLLIPREFVEVTLEASEDT